MGAYRHCTGALSEREAHICTCIAHSEELLRILAVAFAAEGPGHRETKLQSAVVVGRDLAVAPLSACRGMRGILTVVTRQACKTLWLVRDVPYDPSGS